MKKLPLDKKEKKPLPETQDEEIPVRRRKGGPAPKKGAPAWIVTFADLATLMLTFFVLLLSFANTDIVKFKDMLGSVQDAFGVSKKVHGSYQSVLKGEVTEKEKSQSATSALTDAKAKEELERQKMAQQIEKTAQKMGQSKDISVSVESQGVRVRIKGGYFFEPGSASLKRVSLPFLQSIGDLMAEAPFNLKIEGHTDNIPISTPKFASNWELSAIRSTTVLRYFVQQKKIDPQRLMAIGFADNKPVAPNDKSWGRAKNRRVEFIFFK